jgi:tungstate transport system substrate-binding protein
MVALIYFCLSVPQITGSDRKGFDAIYGMGNEALTIAAGSPGALGLLEALAQPFCKDNKCRINWTKKGSGASLAALKAGEVDMVIVHAPAAEQKAVQEGWAVLRTLLCANEFLIVGPNSDPAGIRQARSAAEAYMMIARTGARFFSRGDNSGTHQKEMQIWKSAGIDPNGTWYVVTQDFMGPTLLRADSERGYFMIDSSTFFSKRAKLANIDVLYKGDPGLINVYHALVAPPEKHPMANYDLAAKFLEFMRSSEGQEIFEGFGRKKYGVRLYFGADRVKKGSR